MAFTLYQNTTTEYDRIGHTSTVPPLPVVTLMYFTLAEKTGIEKKKKKTHTKQ